MMLVGSKLLISTMLAPTIPFRLESYSFALKCASELTVNLAEWYRVTPNWLLIQTCTKHVIVNLLSFIQSFNFKFCFSMCNFFFFIFFLYFFFL
jgi:hypothetical protein